MDLDVLALDSREQSVPYDAVLIPVCGKVLKQKRRPFLVSFKIRLSQQGVEEYWRIKAHLWHKSATSATKVAQKCHKCHINLCLYEDDNFFLKCFYLNKQVTCEQYELFSVSFWARPLSLVLNLS